MKKKKQLKKIYIRQINSHCTLCNRSSTHPPPQAVDPVFRRGSAHVALADFSLSQREIYIGVKVHTHTNAK